MILWRGKRSHRRKLVSGVLISLVIAHHPCKCCSRAENTGESSFVCIHSARRAPEPPLTPQPSPERADGGRGCWAGPGSGLLQKGSRPSSLARGLGACPAARPAALSGWKGLKTNTPPCSQAGQSVRGAGAGFRLSDGKALVSSPSSTRCAGRAPGRLPPPVSPRLSERREGVCRGNRPRRPPGAQAGCGAGAGGPCRVGRGAAARPPRPTGGDKGQPAPCPQGL